MAATRRHLDFGHYQINDTVPWPDNTDDLFNTLINPDSFNVPNGFDQRRPSHDYNCFYEGHTSSSGSDSLDHTARLEGDFVPWRLSGMPTDHDPSLPEHFTERFRRQMSIYSSSRAAHSDTNLIVLPTDDIEDDYLQATTAPSTPHWRTAGRKPTDTMLSVRKRGSSVSPSKIEKTQRRVTTMRRASPHKPSMGAASLQKRFEEAATSGQLEAKLIDSQTRIATPPPSTYLRTEEFDFTDEIDQAATTPGSEEAELRFSLSPIMRYNQARDPLDQSAAPVHGLPDLASHEAEGAALYSYPPSSPDQHPETVALTPPATEPMHNDRWSPSAKTSYNASPNFGNMGKADSWFTGVDPFEVTCGAPVSNGSTAFGLGITSMDNEQPRGRIAQRYSHEYNGYPEQAMHSHHSLMHSPRAKVTQHPYTHDSASALSTGLTPTSMYPMSPLLGPDAQCLGYSLSPPRRQHQAVPAYSPTPAQVQSRQTYRPSHQRSHTVGAPITSIPPSMLTRPARADMTFPHVMRSPSPPPVRTAPTTPSRHQRSKSAHHRRKSSTNIAKNSAAVNMNAGFVNFTPNDSRKILTGVAPSGSSKTKARREREAAEKRRKLSEAAKRAVRDAGGDIEALEREVLAFADE